MADDDLLLQRVRRQIAKMHAHLSARGSGLPQDLPEDYSTLEEARRAWRAYHRAYRAAKDPQEEDAKAVVLAPPAAAKERKRRAPSAYNKFIQEQLKELKASHPGATQQQRFKMAAAKWKR